MSRDKKQRYLWLLAAVLPIGLAQATDGTLSLYFHDHDVSNTFKGVVCRNHSVTGVVVPISWTSVQPFEPNLPDFSSIEQTMDDWILARMDAQNEDPNLPDLKFAVQVPPYSGRRFGDNDPIPPQWVMDQVPHLVSDDGMDELPVVWSDEFRGFYSDFLNAAGTWANTSGYDIEIMWVGVGHLGHSTVDLTPDFTASIERTPDDPSYTYDRWTPCVWQDQIDWLRGALSSATAVPPYSVIPLISIESPFTVNWTNNRIYEITRQVAKDQLSDNQIIMFASCDPDTTLYRNRQYSRILCWLNGELDGGLSSTDPRYTIYFRDDFPLYDCDEDPRDENDFRDALRNVWADWNRSSWERLFNLGMMMVDDEFNAADNLGGGDCYNAQIAGDIADFFGTPSSPADGEFNDPWDPSTWGQVGLQRPKDRLRRPEPSGWRQQPRRKR